MAIPLRLLMGIVAWAGALWATLQIANLHTSWDHAICGVWGCGPSLSALVSCHLAWLVVLTPLALVGRAVVPARWQRPIGVTTFVLAVALVMGVVAREAVDWLPTVDASARQYFAQRCLFVIATWIDFPVVELGLLSLLWWRVSDVPARATVTCASQSAERQESDWHPPFERQNSHDHDRS